MPDEDYAGRLIDSRDREYVEKETDPRKREAIVCTITTYRRPDRLAGGDPAPPLVLTRLGSRRRVKLAPSGDRPLVLIFGSYT